MCGIVGFITKSGMLKHKKYFVEALYSDALRGFHSTGMTLVNEHTDIVKTHKKAFQASDFFDLKATDTMINELTNSKVAIGHNRHATYGKIIHENAHPFTHGSITMVHNGSLRSQYELPDYTKFDVDSEVICYSLSQIGVENTISKLNGAFALVWYDAKSKTVNMIRNSERELYIGTTKDSEDVFFASESGMLKWIAERNQIVLDKVELLTVGTLYTFTVPEKKEASKAIVRTERPLTLHQIPNYQGNDNGNSVNQNASNVAYLTGSAEYQKKPTYIAEELSAYGLTFKQEVEVSFYDKAVSGTTYKFTGFLQADPWCECICYSRNPNFIDLDTNYSGQIVGCAGKSTDQTFQVIISKDSLLETGGNGKLPIILNHEVVKSHGVLNLDVRGPDGRMISVGKYKELTKHGCSNCTKDISIHDAESLIWLSGNNPICQECADELGGMLSVLH